MASETAVAKGAAQAYIADAIQANGSTTPNVSAAFEVSRQRRKMIVVWPLLAAQAMAADVADVCIWRTPAAGTGNATGTWDVKSVRYSPQSGGLTANDTNYATISISHNDDAGGSLTAVASVTTQITGGSGNWTANRSVNIPAATNPSIPAGKALHFVIAKTGSGVVVPSGIVFLELEET